MTITIETVDSQQLEHLLRVLKSLNIKNINITEASHSVQQTITKGNKKIDPKALFGIWRDSPRTLAKMRTEAWQRNWSI